MYKIIKNTENGKYFTGSYRDGFWSRDIEDAYLFPSEDEIHSYLRKIEMMDSAFEYIKMIIIETVYKINH